MNHTASDYVTDAEMLGRWIVTSFDGIEGRVAYRRIPFLTDEWVYWDEQNDEGHMTKTRSVKQAVAEADTVELMDSPPFSMVGGGSHE